MIRSVKRVYNTKIARDARFALCLGLFNPTGKHESSIFMPSEKSNVGETKQAYFYVFTVYKCRIK